MQQCLQQCRPEAQLMFRHIDRVAIYSAASPGPSFRRRRKTSSTHPMSMLNKATAASPANCLTAGFRRSWMSLAKCSSPRSRSRSRRRSRRRPADHYVKVNGRWTYLYRADPVGVGLGRNGESDVGQGVQHLGGAVFAPVLVAGDQDTPDLAVVGPLAGLVEVPRPSVESLDHKSGHRGLVPEPDGRGEHDDVGRLDQLAIQVGEVVDIPALFALIWVDARRDGVVDDPDRVDACSDTRGTREDASIRPSVWLGVGDGLQGAVRTTAWRSLKSVQFAAISASMNAWTWSCSTVGLLVWSAGPTGAGQSVPGPVVSTSIPFQKATRPLMRRASGEGWR